MKTISVFTVFNFFILQGIHSQLPNKELYFFDEFRNATINFRDKTEKDYKLNFSFLHNELCYLDEYAQMIMIVKNINEVEDFDMDGRSFFVSGNNLMEVLCVEPALSVQYKKSVRPAAEGSYGTLTDATASVASVGFRVDSWSMDRILNQRFKIGKMNYIYSVKDKDGNGLTFRNKKQLHNVYPDYKNEIDTYIKKNAVKFDNTVQILELIMYIHSL